MCAGLLLYWPRLELRCLGFSGAYCTFDPCTVSTGRLMKADPCFTSQYGPDFTRELIVDE